MTTDEQEDIYNKIFREVVTEQMRWIVAGIIGFSVFFICCGILGVVAVFKSIFL